jgi:hypothetical protein
LGWKIVSKLVGIVRVWIGTGGSTVRGTTLAAGGIGIGIGSPGGRCGPGMVPGGLGGLVGVDGQE